MRSQAKNAADPSSEVRPDNEPTVKLLGFPLPCLQEAQKPGSIPRFSMMLRCLEILTNRESQLITWLHMELIWLMFE